MSRIHVITDAATGKITQIPYTAEEEAAADLANQPPPSAVKAEAARRIDLIMKDYEQRNALALGQEMVLTYGPDATKWPADKRATLSAMMGKWAAIKAVRVRSNDIEAMKPIPADFTDDEHWQ
ncbi:MAG TPA: hypothetical protein VGV07_22310 [Devosia sp.]|jgi:hypothetical protein|uniref:hypothetical protein n=1 Tax=Devosia sp. TaxID=1871048 RepID=UPI002DDD2825|nr:hypothetical protein [Devosia sp.]HEV2518002.1 hypothetical protein [Devosia sp.]